MGFFSGAVKEVSKATKAAEHATKLAEEAEKAAKAAKDAERTTQAARGADKAAKAKKAAETARQAKEALEKARKAAEHAANLEKAEAATKASQAEEKASKATERAAKAGGIVAKAKTVAKTTVIAGVGGYALAVRNASTAKAKAAVKTQADLVKGKNGSPYLDEQQHGDAETALEKAGGDVKLLPRAIKEMRDAGVAPEDVPGAMADWLENDKKPWYQKMWNHLTETFQNPNSFGVGSAIGALGLGALGAWMGGGGATSFILGGLLALGGAVVPALMNQTPVVPVATPPSDTTQKKNDSEPSRSAQPQPEIKAPTFAFALPPVKEQGKTP